MTLLEGVVPFPPEFAARYREKGYWEDQTMGHFFDEIFAKTPERVAFLADEKRVTYRELAQTVERLALHLLTDSQQGQPIDFELRQALKWAADLHEVGRSISHNSYHKHSAYIVGNADMPGFSKPEQALLASLQLGHTGKLPKVRPMKVSVAA